MVMARNDETDRIGSDNGPLKKRLSYYFPGHLPRHVVRLPDAISKKGGLVGMQTGEHQAGE